MALNKTTWQVIVQAQTGQFERGMLRVARAAGTAQATFDAMQRTTNSVTQEISTTPRVFDEMASAIKKGKINWEQYQNTLRNTRNIVKRQNQLQSAAVTQFQATDGAMTSTMLTMRKFKQAGHTMAQQMAVANMATRAFATGIVDMGKNMQWAGRQITVGFTVPFGIAMLGASAAFLKFEKEVIRFRKVFNEELGTTTEEAEERVVKLATTMARQLGTSRNEILETAATFAQMGKSIEEVERLTTATTRLALLGEVPRETSTQLLRAYEASGFDEMAGGLENIVNHLNAVENSTSLTVEMMASSLPQIIPIFEQVNLQFGEGEAIVAGMVQSLGNASEAVNALKVGLQRVYDPTTEAKKAFNEIGVNLDELRNRFSGEAGSEGGIIEYFQELGRIMEEGIEGNAEFAETIGNLFGVRQAGRLATGLRAVNDETSDFTRAMAVMGRTAEENAATAESEISAMTESIGGRLNRLKEGIIADITDIGKTFLEMAMPLFEQVASLINRFSNLDEGVQKAIIALAGLAAGFGGLIMITGIAINLFGMAIKTLTGLGPTLAMVTEKQVGFLAQLAAFNGKGQRAVLTTNHLTTASKRLALAKESERKAMLGAANAVGIYNTSGRPGAIGGATARVAGTGGLPAPGPGRAKVKWRKGVGALGLGMMGASMLPGVGEEAGQGLMAGSIATQAVAMLGGRGKGLADIGKRMKEASAAAGSMTGKLGKGAAMAKTLAAGLATSTGVLAVVAGGAYLVYKHVQNAKKEAAKLRNEFQLSGDIASDLGLELEKGAGNLSTAWGGQTKEEAEELSESMRTIVDRVNELRGQDGGGEKIQAIFRNMSREWLAGGATIDEINEKLSELEAIVGVSIDEQSRSLLRQNVSKDISDAINDALLNFSGDTSFWRSIWQSGQRFSFSDEESVRNTVQALMGGIQSSLAVEGGVTDISTMLGEFYNARSAAVGDDAEALAEFNRIAQETMELRFNIPEEHAEELESIEETFSYVYSRLASDKDALIKMSEEERANLYQLLEAYGKYELYVRNASVADEEFAQSVNDSRVAIAGAGMELGNLGEEMRVESDALSTLDNRYTNFIDLLARGTGGEISATIGRLEGMREEFSDNAEMVQYLDVVVRALQDHLSLGFVAPFKIISQSEIDDLAKRARHRENMAAARGAGKTIGGGITDGIKEAAEDGAKSYINAFRSELDRQRDEIIKDILDQYDEQTEEILNGLEERHEKEVESLEATRDSEIEALEERKNAIDEYLDKQKAMEDALDKQLDLILAIAGGDLDKAAQLQNEMMFQNIEGVAEAEKENLDGQQERLEEIHDEKIERMEELHEEQISQEEEQRKKMRKTLEEQLELTNDIFIGTEKGWNKFLGEVGRTAKKFDVEVNKNLTNGYNKAMDKIIADARMDDLWRDTDFSVLRQKLQPFLEDLKEGISDAFEAGGLEGTDTVVRAMDSYIRDYIGKLDAGGGATTAQDELNLINMLTGSNDTNGGAVPSDFKDAEVPPNVKHSGGPIGGGPPRDVPIIAQTGEYMIQRKAAQNLGRETLDMLNSYHSGGPVGIGRLFGARAAGPMASALMSSLTGNISMPGNTGAGPTSALKPPDADWTRGSSKYYGGWTYALSSGIIQRAATQLARLPGAQAVVNAYRDRGHNAAVGGSPNSDHLRGKAIDFVNASGATTPSWVDRMGAWFEGQQGVRWVGRPATDRSGGHDDHVHVSYYHDGGAVSLMKGGKIMKDNTPVNAHRGELVVRRPLAQSLEAGIEKLNSGDINSQTVFKFHIENFGGSPAEARRFTNDVEEILDRNYRKRNPTRRIS